MLKKRNLLFLSLLILGVLLVTSCLPKPPVTEGILKGQVMVPEGSIQTKDLTGQALPDATVNIIDLTNGEIIATTTTDANGYYQVFVPPGGPYLLEAVKDGVKLQQITPPVEAGIEYDLGTADCTTTAVALIVQSMLDAGADLADINLADIEADPNFDEVLSNVTSIIESGQDPTTSSAVNQAVEDFLYPPEPTPTPAPTPTYSVTYNGNGNTGGTVPVDLSSPYANGASVTVLDNTGTLTKTQDGISLLFTGWNTASDGSGTSYDEAATFNMGSANLTLYDQWSVLRGTGPAGGLIFYDKGSVSDGWRYLEAASVDQSKGKWGTLNLTVPGADGTDIGTGKQNTLDIITGDILADKAADKCASYSVALGAITYNDWFLPSKDEIYLMYTNLHVEGVGNFSGTATDYQYYSSSEYDPYKTWFQSFYNGNQQDGSKFAYDFRSRPARVFRSIAPTYLVNYNANSATSGSVPSDPYHYEPGESVSVLTNTGSLAKDGYIFDGWNTESDGSGTDRAPGSAFNIGNDNVTFYAKWIATIDIAVIPGVTAPVTGATPVTTITETAQYTGTVTWDPADDPFLGGTAYTATITLSAKTGYTLTGVTENFFTVAGAVATNPVNSGVVTAAFPATTATVINIAAIPGVTVPVTGATPDTAITETAQYTGTISWSPADNPFKGDQVYTATITLTAKAGYTLTGVAANFFTVAGATSDTNPVNSGVVTAAFPATTYSLRDIGPAGGLIFYINPNYATDGWKYLEAAPASTEGVGIDWGGWGDPDAPIGGTETGIGTGMDNTGIIVDWLNNRFYVNKAAQLCYTLEFNGYDDWFLPSQDELHEIYNNLIGWGVGGFATVWNVDYYWTSSENDAGTAFQETFYNGYQSTFSKSAEIRVRAVRSF
jgi:uncharacterized repeat protein (TIGR02543 family)